MILQNRSRDVTTISDSLLVVPYLKLEASISSYNLRHLYFVPIRSLFASSWIWLANSHVGNTTISKVTLELDLMTPITSYSSTNNDIMWACTFDGSEYLDNFTVF
uniref:Ig-like domain-containing protein n=1 Tax=Strongyloides venezuelensis TaxID=75913 RepID=A0A0K0FJ56_STRVS